jgi:hypothetical protein
LGQQGRDVLYVLLFCSADTNNPTKLTLVGPIPFVSAEPTSQVVLVKKQIPWKLLHIIMRTSHALHPPVTV